MAAIGTALDEDHKILIAVSFLGEVPRREYDVKIARDGKFRTYKEFETWIREYYSPQDLIAHYRDQYCDCKQQSGETFDRYHLRFSEILNKLDRKPEVTWQVSDFVKGIDKNYKKHLDRHEDMSTFEDVTLDDVVRRMNRSIRMAGETDASLAAKSGKTSSSDGSGTGGRVMAAPINHILGLATAAQLSKVSRTSNI